jgi:hypothetical protein
MLNRYRWYRIQLPSGTSDLSGVIAKYPLVANSNQGFTKIESSLGAPNYRFLWRSKVVITQFNDSGIPAYQEVSTVNFTDFAIVSIEGATFLRIENPGRSIRDLLNAIEALVGLGFTCKPVTFESTKPTTVFEKIETIKLIGLKVIGVVLEEDLVARMEFASKQGITLDKLAILEGVPHKIESASYELIYQGVKGQLAFTSNGTAKVSGQLAPKLIQLVEQDLSRIA